MAFSFRAEQAANRRKTWFLLAGMFVSVIAIIWAVGNLAGVTTVYLFPIAVTVALAGVWASYWHSDTLVLTMTKARVIDAADAPQLWNLVEEVTLAAGLPMPKIAIVDDPAPNAFATGRDPKHAVVAFTTGILTGMDREQLQGVAAHELAHVANRDTLVMAVAATTAGLIAVVSDLALRMTVVNRRGGSNQWTVLVAIAALILAPLAAIVLKSAISRKREALADATAVAFTRNPTGLRRALEHLAADSTVVAAKSNAVAHLWIESPLDAKASRWFATHPPIEDRIAALIAMEGGQAPR